MLSFQSKMADMYGDNTSDAVCLNRIRQNLHTLQYKILYLNSNAYSILLYPVAVHLEEG